MFYLRNLSGQNLLFFQNMGPRQVGPHRAMMVTSMFFLISPTCDHEMITDISSIQFRLSFMLK